MSETHTPNDEHKIFVTTYIETATKYILTKPSARCRVLWKSIAIREKQNNLKKKKIKKSIIAL